MRQNSLEPIYVLKAESCGGLPLPSKAHQWDAGFDLSAADDVAIGPGERAPIATGFIWRIPRGYVGRISPRSGLAVKQGIDILAGVVDSGYTGEVKVVLVNHGEAPLHVKRGDRIAQMVITAIHPSGYVTEGMVDYSERGDNGFGSSGK